MSRDRAAFQDEELIAFLDGEADTALAARITAAKAEDATLRARLAALQTPIDAMKAAFDLDALDAPQIPDGLIAETPAPANKLFAPLAMAASFVLGAFAMNLWTPQSTWVDQVASYQALYVADTLSGGQQPPERTAATLAVARDDLQLNLDEIPEIPGMAFIRAQVLAIADTPLIQIAYLGDDGVPFALCVTRVGAGDDQVITEMTHDLAAASWIKGDLGFVLIGGTDADRVSTLAVTLSQTL